MIVREQNELSRHFRLVRARCSSSYGVGSITDVTDIDCGSTLGAGRFCFCDVSFVVMS